MATGEVKIPNNQKGFTYIGLLFIVALLGISLALAGTLWSFAQKREKERELIFIGNQFRQAIGLYYEKSPGYIKTYPPTLEKLLEDDRYVSLQRYLRRIYVDPMTGQPDWGVVIAPQGGVMGVYSQSNRYTIKVYGFKLGVQMLNDQKRYSDWKFVYIPVNVAALNK